MGLEATYEESKRNPVHGGGQVPPRVWKLPMRNPSTAPNVAYALNYGVWKLPMRNPSGKGVRVKLGGRMVWKLPMRNPSSEGKSGLAAIPPRFGSYL